MSRNDLLSMRGDQVASLFPFHIIVDRAMLVMQAGESLRRICPGMETGARFADHFEVVRPQTSGQFDDIAHNQKQLFILAEKSGRFRLRGQFLILPDPERLVFVGAPWVQDASMLKDLGLTLPDFAIHDSISDLLQLVQMERAAFQDLQKMAARLKEQRTQLQLVNEQLRIQNAEAQKLSLIAARTSNGVVLSDRLGRIEWVNEGFTRITGYTLDEVRGRTPGSVLQGPDTDSAKVEWIRGKISRGEDFQAELVNYAKSGRRYWIAIEVQPIRDESGNVRHFMAIQTDITERKESEAKLRASEARHRALLDSIPDLIFRIREDGLFLDYSARDTTDLLLPPEAFLNKSIEEFFPPGLAAFTKENIRAAIQTHSLRMFEYKMEIKGRPAVFEARIVPAAEQEVTLIVANITRRKRTERHLVVQHAVSKVLSEAGSMEDASSRLLQSLGGILECGAGRIWIGDSQGRGLRLEREWRAEASEQPVQTVPNRLAGDVWKSGTTKWIHENASTGSAGRTIFAFPLNSGDRVLGVFELFCRQREEMDEEFVQMLIAAGDQIGQFLVRKEAEQAKAESLSALRVSEERYRIVAETASDAILTVGAEGRILYANKAAADIFGYCREELESMPWTQLFPQEMQLPPPDQAPAGNPHGALHATGRRKDGKDIQLEISFGEWDTGEGRIITAIIRDVTLRREVEEQRQLAKEAAEAANRAKTEFLANISHEIRTPLNAIIGMTELTMQTRLTQRQIEYQQIVRTAAESLLQLVNDLLDRSKIEAGQIDLEAVDFDPGAVCEETVAILKEVADAKGLAVHCIVKPLSPPWVIGDPNRLRQILINLVGNGIKFTSSGYVSLALHWSLKESPARATLFFEVSDTGIGINPGDSERVFEKFVQLDARRYGGTGLGLSIAKSLANAMGGLLRLGPPTGSGTTFLFDLELPLAVRQHEGSDMPEDSGLPVWLYSNALDSHLLLDAWQSWSAGAALCSTVKELRTRMASEAYGMVIVDPDPKSDSTLKELADCFDEHAGISPVILLRRGADSADFHRRFPRARLVERLIVPSQIGKILTRASEEPVESAPCPEFPIDRSAEDFPPAEILVVEDNEMNRTLVLHLLESAGYRIRLASNGSEAVEAAARRRHDLILMDVQLPDLDGFEATRRIRARERELGQPRVPIVALTAHAIQEYQQLAFASGMDDYITKPIRGDRLRSIVRKWLPAQPESEAGGDSADHADTPAAGESGIVLIAPECADLVTDYLKSVKLDCARLADRLAIGDFKLLRETAHNLKGSGGAYGFPEISVIGRLLEEAGKREDKDEVAQLIFRLDQYVSKVRWQPAPQ